MKTCSHWGVIPLAAFVLVMLVATPLPSAHASRIVVLSDIHVYRSGAVPDSLGRAVKEVLQQRPDLVVLLGDMTNGNPNDAVSIETPRQWWQNLKNHLKPLADAGIAMAPIPGNHDWYTQAHRTAYREAWSTAPAGVQVDGDFPVHYRIRTEDTELFFLPMTDQTLTNESRDFLEMNAPTGVSHLPRIAFGHVPLASRMGKSSASFQNSLGGLLREREFSLYVSGHEHLTWEEDLPVPGGLLRQLWVGTATATYTFPITQSLFDSYCQRPVETLAETLCRMPSNGRHFRVRTSNRAQVHEQVLGMKIGISNRLHPAPRGAQMG